MADDDARKLFVAGLSDAVVDDVLKEVFAATGATHVDVNIPRDRATGRPRGFAFVILGSAEEAANARKILDGSVQGGRPIAVRPFRAEGPGREERSTGADNHSSTEDRTLYIRNLPYESSRDEIAELFKSYGVEGVERVHLPVGPDGRGKGFGFVTMSSAASAQASLPLLRNASLRGRPIAANIARSRDERPTSAPSSPPMSRSGGSEFPPPPPRGDWRPEGRRESRRFDSPDESPRGEEELPAANAGEARKEKKKKKGGGGTDSPRTNRRQDEGFRSPRGRAQIDDWDDD